MSVAFRNAKERKKERKKRKSIALTLIQQQILIMYQNNVMFFKIIQR